jgi:hypothetical protein
MEQGRHTAPLNAIHDIGQLHRGLIKEQQIKSSRLMYCTLQEDDDESINQSPNFFTFKKPKNRFQGTNSSLAGRNDNPIPTRFLAPQRLFSNFSTALATIVIETGLNRGRNRHYSALLSTSWFKKAKTGNTSLYFGDIRYNIPF